MLRPQPLFCFQRELSRPALLCVAPGATYHVAGLLCLSRGIGGSILALPRTHWEILKSLLAFGPSFAICKVGLDPIMPVGIPTLTVQDLSTPRRWFAVIPGFAVDPPDAFLPPSLPGCLSLGSLSSLLGSQICHPLPGPPRSCDNVSVLFLPECLRSCYSQT